MFLLILDLVFELAIFIGPHLEKTLWLVNVANHTYILMSLIIHLKSETWMTVFSLFVSHHFFHHLFFLFVNLKNTASKFLLICNTLKNTDIALDNGFWHCTMRMFFCFLVVYAIYDSHFDLHFWISFDLLLLFCPYWNCFVSFYHEYSVHLLGYTQQGKLVQNKLI